MCLSLIDLEILASPNQYFMSLLVRQGQINEMGYKATELIKNQVCIGLQLKLLFFFLSLDETLETFEAFLKDVRVLT